MEVHFATTNKGKVVSLRNTLSEYGIEVVHHPLNLPEPRSDDLQEIAREKVLFAYEKIGKPCVAVDAGFYVPSLNGFPKAFVNFALGTIGIEGLLRLTEGKPKECAYRNCLAYIDGSLQEPVFFESEVPGTLAESPRGTMREYHWSKLCTIFIPQGHDKTQAEMTISEYNAWKDSRRDKSFHTAFGRWMNARGQPKQE